MCTEFILALLYLIIILAVNFFLFKLLKTYLKNILNLIKFQNILKNFKITDVTLISFLYSIDKNNFSNLNNLNKIIYEENLNEKKDILILGNIYKLISNSINKKTIKNYYFDLLEQQYLS